MPKKQDSEPFYMSEIDVDVPGSVDINTTDQLEPDVTFNVDIGSIRTDPKIS
jgi:hypothetical protein